MQLQNGVGEVANRVAELEISMDKATRIRQSETPEMHDSQQHGDADLDTSGTSLMRPSFARSSTEGQTVH